MITPLDVQTEQEKRERERLEKITQLRHDYIDRKLLAGKTRIMLSDYEGLHFLNFPVPSPELSELMSSYQLNGWNVKYVEKTAGFLWWRKTERYLVFSL